jgi:predicted PurR-regulated permease PerM
MTLSSAQRQTLSWTAIALAAFVLLWLLAPVLAPFLVGAVMAYALHPAVEWLAQRRVPRWLAVSLMVLFALFLSFALLLLVVPVVTKEIPLLRQQLPLLLDRLDKSVAPGSPSSASTWRSTSRASRPIC